jgi:hypothetical protein
MLWISSDFLYILVYVDNLLIIDKMPKKFMSMIRESFTVKPLSIEEPKSYLGVLDINKAYYSVGSYAWTMGSETYVKKVVQILKKKMEKDGLKFNKKFSDPAISVLQPFSSVGYRPEINMLVECNDAQVTLFQNVIGILQWVVELDIIGIAFEVSILSWCYLVQPRTGHLLQVLHIFKYLDIHSKNELAFNPAIHEIDDPTVTSRKFNAMKDTYPDVQEYIPPSAPEPHGNYLQVNCFVDSDHAGDRVT